MNISLLSKMVREIILDHDRVSLPGLGSFVAQMVPSSFSDKGYTIHPPYRRLSFRNTNSEDDYLVQLYAQVNEVDTQLAEKIIRDFVDEIKEELNSSKLVVFPGLGKLRATKENIYFFIVDADTDIWPAGSGMQPVSLKSHNDNDRESVQLASVFGTVDVPEEVTSEEIPDEPMALDEPEDTVPVVSVSPVIPESVESAPEDGVAFVEEFDQETIVDAPEEPSPEEPSPEEPSPEESELEPTELEPAPEATEPEPAPEATEPEPAPEATAPEEIAPEAPVTEEEIPQDPIVAPLLPENDPDVTYSDETYAFPVEPEPVEGQQPVENSQDAGEPYYIRYYTPGLHKGKTFFIVVLVVIAVLALMLSIFILLAHFCPDLIDKLLYSPAELDILHHA